MKVNVLAFAGFREILGKLTVVEIEEGSTISDLIYKLSKINSHFHDMALESSGAIKDYVVLMKNRKNISSLEGLATVLRDGDEVAIFPPVCGG